MIESDVSPRLEMELLMPVWCPILMRRFAVAVAVVLTLAACGDGVDEPGISASSVSVSSTPLSEDQSELRSALSAIEDDGLAYEPILVMTRVCYSTCPRTFARPEFAMYPDGSLVAVDRQSPGDSNSPFRLRVFDLSESDLDLVAELLQVGGLTTGDVHAAGTRAGRADGDGVVLESVIHATRTYVHAPFLNSPDNDPARNALFGIRELFRSYADNDSGTSLPMRWVMVGEKAIEPDAPPWPGDESATGDPPCLAFDPDDLMPGFERLPLQAEHEAAGVSFDGDSYIMTSRPLLPHEEGCDDVQSRLNRMFASDSALDLGGEG